MDGLHPIIPCTFPPLFWTNLWDKVTQASNGPSLFIILLNFLLWYKYIYNKKVCQQTFCCFEGIF